MKIMISKNQKKKVYLVNLTNINTSNYTIPENNKSHPFSKVKLIKENSKKKKYDQEIQIKDYNSNNYNNNNKQLFDNINSNTKRNYSYSELNSKLDKSKNDIFNNKKTISNSNNDLYFDFENKSKKKEKILKDKFYEKAEIKKDYFGLREPNKRNYSKDKLIKIDSSQKYFTERNISNPKSPFKYNSNENINNINIKERELPYNFIMPVNPMNDVISAKVNYLYGNNK